MHIYIDYGAKKGFEMFTTGTEDLPRKDAENVKTFHPVKEGFINMNNAEEEMEEDEEEDEEEEEEEKEEGQ